MRKSKNVLAFHEEVTVGPLVSSFTTEDLTTQPYLAVDLHPELLEAVGTDPVEAVKFRSFELVRGASNLNIQKELPAENCEAALWQAALLTGNQKNGEQGSLTTEFGRANLFFLADCVIRVWWDGTQRVWNIRDWDPGMGYWEKGDRIFCPVDPRLLQ